MGIPRFAQRANTGLFAEYVTTVMVCIDIGQVAQFPVNQGLWRTYS